MTIEKKTTKVNLRRLIRILGTNLYSSPDVCLRELVQNACDALMLRTAKFQSIRLPQRIKIRADLERHCLTVSDTGIGMTVDEIDDFLSHVANTNKEQLQGITLCSQHDEEEAIVGAFGIGFLSSFLIADRVEVVTRSAEAEKSCAVVWESDGDEYYITSEKACEKDFIGTQIRLFLKPSFGHLLERTELVSRIRRYCDFTIYPIYLGDEPGPINQTLPPWRMPGAVDVDYTQYAERIFYNMKFLAVIPLEFDGLVGGFIIIPEVNKDQENANQGIALHADRFFVTETISFLPSTLSFLRGVIDTKGLTLLLSREAFIDNVVAKTLKIRLTQRVAQGLKEIAVRQPRTFTEIIRVWELQLKIACIEDESIYQHLVEHLPVVANNEPMNFSTLQRRIIDGGEGQGITYFSDPSSQRQYTNLLAEHGRLVVDATKRVDFLLVHKFAMRQDVGIRSADEAISSLVKPVDDNEEWRDLTTQLAQYASKEYGIQLAGIEAARFDLTDIPAIMCVRSDKSPQSILTSGHNDKEDSINFAMHPTVRSILYINVEHPLIVRLAELIRGPALGAGKFLKTKMLIMRGLIDAAFIHSGRCEPSVLNRYLRNSTQALLHLVELHGQSDIKCDF